MSEGTVEGIALVFGVLFSVGFAVVIGYAGLRSLAILFGVEVRRGGQLDTPPHVAAGPSWRIRLPDGEHRVSLDDDRPHPSLLRCDEQWVEVAWPLKWRGSPEAEFMVSGHRARLVESLDWRRSISREVVLSMLLGGGAATFYRHDLHVDGASVNRLDAGAISASR